MFGPLAEANINVDMIIQNVGRDKGETDVTFTVPKADLARAQALLEEHKDADRLQPHHHRRQGRQDQRRRRRHAQPCGHCRTMFKALADRGINIQAISTSEIKVSVLIDEDETELAVRVLHTAYGLDAVDDAA